MRETASKKKAQLRADYERATNEFIAAGGKIKRPEVIHGIEAIKRQIGVDRAMASGSKFATISKPDDSAINELI